MIAMLHLFRFDPHTVAAPAGGQRLGEKYRLGAWACVMCKILLDFAVRYDLDHGTDCPGWVRPAPLDAGL